jgi:transposase
MALRPYDRQGDLLGPSPDSVLPHDHLARVIDELVESIAVGRLNDRYEHTPGEPAYDVRLLSKVWIYAYARGLTSSREVARQCVENLAFRFLTSNQCPDHRTLSRFRRQKRRLLRWIFAKTVQIGRRMGLVRLGVVAIDSVKLRADANPSRKRTAEQLQEQLGKLDAYLAEVEAQDRQQDAAAGSQASGEQLPKKLRRLQHRRQQLARALQKLQQDQATQQAQAKAHVRQDVIPSDPEAVWVKKQGKIIPGYNPQAAVDDTCGMVVALKALADPSDREQLNPMIVQVQKTAGTAAANALADNGYYSDEAIIAAETGPTRCWVPDGQTAKQLNQGAAVPVPAAYHCDQFAYDAASDTFRCPQGRPLVVLKKHTRRGQPTTVYRGTACGDCPVHEQCTEDRQGVRTIEVPREYAIVRRAHERVRSEDGRRMYGRRKAIVEPVFGQWQHNRGVRRLRLRGLQGCDIEVHLLAIGHNAMKFWKRGVKFGKS